jgi:hypothetical protein
MDLSGRATIYDLFKAIVATLLLVLFFYLRQASTPQATPPAPTASSPAVFPDTDSITTSDLTLSSPAATSTPIPASTTPSPGVSPTQVDTPTPGATPLASPIEADSDSTAGDTVPSVTPPSGAEATPTPTASTPVPLTACEAAQARSRLEQGMNATILRRLNFRSSPGIADNWLRTNIPGTPVEVVGGPECLPYYTGAYVWWQIRLPDGEIGWSAEGSMHGSFYFMEPSE